MIRIQIRIEIFAWIRIRQKTNADLKHCLQYSLMLGHFDM
jgi:hypothetical protein